MKNKLFWEDEGDARKVDEALAKKEGNWDKVFVPEKKITKIREILCKYFYQSLGSIDNFKLIDQAEKEIIASVESLIPIKYLNEDDNIIHGIVLLDTYKKGANDVIRLFEKRIEELKK